MRSGMSTVLETIAARALGLTVVGFSLITNVHLYGRGHLACRRDRGIAARRARRRALDRRHRREHRHAAAGRDVAAGSRRTSRRVRIT